MEHQVKCERHARHHYYILKIKKVDPGDVWALYNTWSTFVGEIKNMALSVVWKRYNTLSMLVRNNKNRVPVLY